MASSPGRPPKPTEQKRKLGNPGKRPLPEVVHALPVQQLRPDPPRPLGPAGMALWERAWENGSAWIAVTDLELLLVTCEQVDERQALRLRVLRDNDWRERAGLRALDKCIQDGLGMLGFSPSDRARLGVAEVKVANALEEVRRRRQQNARPA